LQSRVTILCIIWCWYRTSFRSIRYYSSITEYSRFYLFCVLFSLDQIYFFLNAWKNASSTNAAIKSLLTIMTASMLRLCVQRQESHWSFQLEVLSLYCWHAFQIVITMSDFQYINHCQTLIDFDRRSIGYATNN